MVKFSNDITELEWTKFTQLEYLEIIPLDTISVIMIATHDTNMIQYNYHYWIVTMCQW